MNLSIVNSIYCFQSFFFFTCIGQNRFGWKEHQIQWKNGLGMWLAVPGAEELSGATPFLRPQGFWPMLLSSLCSPASVLVYHHTLSSQHLPAPGLLDLTDMASPLSDQVRSFSSVSREALIGSLTVTCHLSWSPFPFGVGRGWAEELQQGLGEASKVTQVTALLSLLEKEHHFALSLYTGMSGGHI